MTLDILVKTYKTPKLIPNWLAWMLFSKCVTNNESNSSDLLHPSQISSVSFVKIKKPTNQVCTQQSVQPFVENTE